MMIELEIDTVILILIFAIMLIILKKFEENVHIRLNKLNKKE
jgi:hypothetical protein